MWGWWLAACTAGLTPTVDKGDTAAPTDTDVATDSDPADTDLVDDTPPCAPEGTPECPIVIPSTPWGDSRDSWDSPSEVLNTYACAPSTDESGPEFVYRLDVDEPGIIAFSVDADPGVDIDVHIASAPTEAACKSRGHLATSWFVQPGSWYLIADTWVDGAGVEQGGGFTISVDFLPLGDGPCAMTPTDLDMYWNVCSLGLDCSTRGRTVTLHTPSIGPVVKEAHLVTDEEAFATGWPTAARDQIQRHYQLSAAATGYTMDRTEPWAPEGEGGSRWGQGATAGYVPARDEAWYVNMYWRDRPAPGTRIVVVNPFTGGAVIASGGWETGPGNQEHLGGATEEIHDALHTDHTDPLLFGIAADQDLPLGPVRCWP